MCGQNLLEKIARSHIQDSEFDIFMPTILHLPQQHEKNNARFYSLIPLGPRQSTEDVFERTFKEFGLPKAIRTDNGQPFASGNALFGLSRLSVWWLRLGISIERIKPGNPQENGRHERMHLTLKKEAAKPAGENLLQQQEKFDAFIDAFNFQRPHQALNMKFPSELYAPSPRPYKGIQDILYPFHDRTVTVTHCGRICISTTKINLSQALSGQDVGITEVQEGIWLVSFMEYDLGYFDVTSRRFEPLPYPFAPKIV
jgi:putative transposase